MVTVEIARVERGCSSPLRFQAELLTRQYSEERPATLRLSLLWDGERPVSTENDPVSHHATLYSEHSAFVLLRTGNRCERDRNAEEHGMWKVDPTSNFPAQDLGTHVGQLQPGEAVERVYEVWQSPTSDRLALNSEYEFEVRIRLVKAEWCVFGLVLSVLDDRSDEGSNGVA